MYNDVIDRLEKNNLTYSWLMSRLAEQGMVVNKVTMSNWVHGKQTNQRSDEIMEEAKKILDRYECGMREE